MSEHNAETRRKPVDYDELFPGRFVKAGLLGGKRRTVTIEAVDTEPMPQDDGKTRVRGILTIRTESGNITEFILNSTNGQCIRAMFGRKPQEWVGKRLTLQPEKDRFGRDVVDAVRIAGSPDIPQAIEIMINMPRKKPKTRRLERTGGGNGRASQPESVNADGEVTSAPQREPGDD